jgi:hypothetical protein
VQSAHRSTRPHVRDRPGQWLGPDGEGLTGAGLFLQARQIVLARRMVAQTQHGGFGTGPLQGRVAAREARGALPCAGGCLRPLHQAARGDNILHPREALDSMHCVKQDHAADCAHPGEGWPAGEGLGLVLLGRLHDGECASRHSLVTGADEGEVDLQALRDRRSGAPLRDAVPMRFGGELLAKSREGVWAVGMLDVGQPPGPLAHERQATSQEIARGPPRSGGDGGRREQAPTQQDGHVLRLDPVVCGLPPVHDFHVQRMAQHTRQACTCAESSEPVPGDEACDGDDDSVPRGCDDLEKGVRTRFATLVDHDLPMLAQDTQVHGAGVEIDAAVHLMVFGVESHEIRCRRTGHTHRALVKLLKELFTKKARSHAHRHADPPCP